MTARATVGDHVRAVDVLGPRGEAGCAPRQTLAVQSALTGSTSSGPSLFALLTKVLTLVRTSESL